MKLRFCRLCGRAGGTLRRVRNAEGETGFIHAELGVGHGKACLVVARRLAHPKHVKTSIAGAAHALAETGVSQELLNRWAQEVGG